MNRDHNIATRRLLQVVLDMLSNPNYATENAEREGKLKRNESVYGIPSPYRTDVLAVEAAVRAAKEAQSMLAEAQAEFDALPKLEWPTQPMWQEGPGTAPVHRQASTADAPSPGVNITCLNAEVQR